VARLLRMPEVAANTGEAILGTWAVPEGGPYRTGEVLATVETAKAAVDVEADHDGVLVKTIVAQGGEVEVGTPIALLAESDEVIADVAAELDALLRAVGAEKATTLPPSPGRFFVSPLARRLAREAGIAVEEIRGTGPHDRIVRRDIESAIANRNSTAPAATGAEYVDRPHPRMRKAIAASLTASKQTVPHFYLRGSARVDALLRLREELNDGADVRISINDFVLKAVAVAHIREPRMNVIWTDTAVRQFAAVDLAFAVATADGLLAPVVRSVETLNIFALATATADLAERARAGTLRQHEVEGGSATVTNLGALGTEEFTAIINPPHSAILAVGAVREEAIVRDRAVVAGSVLRMTVSVDHRPVDGVVAAEWMRHLLDALERPVQLLR
jgi:pyruvate dehydrogenase E2 component (dihydrolipoamide acetyltransferase)